MGRYCDGDARAFQQLYALLAPRILAYLIGLIGERALAEDLLQQTFLKLHQSAVGVRARRQPGALDLHHRPPHLPGRASQAQGRAREVDR